MYKFFYCVGIYSFCIFVHKNIEYWSERAEKKMEKKKEEPKDQRNKSVNLSEKKVGGPINKIGF